ncbi:MAG: hypothetical protein KGL39_57785, partial [Patescibacteria group bacterium]|nr:hypothetical protein [Patescibacteria group bacterium]
DIGALQALANAGVFGSEHRGVKVIPAGNEFTAHQASRKSRGRVTAKTQPYAEPGDSYLKQYIRDSRHAVGQAKGGWVSSLMRLGGRAAGWITRHIRAGSYRDNLKPNQNNLNFTMINRSKWASGGDEDRIIDRVLANRGEMVKADIALMLQNNWKRTPTGRVVPR